jgi:hypothetical protein
MEVFRFEYSASPVPFRFFRRKPLQAMFDFTKRCGGFSAPHLGPRIIVSFLSAGLATARRKEAAGN